MSNLDNEIIQTRLLKLENKFKMPGHNFGTIEERLKRLEEFASDTEEDIDALYAYVMDLNEKVKRLTAYRAIRESMERENLDEY